MGEKKLVEKMNKIKLVCVIMGQNVEKFINMSLESVKTADAIVYIDGGSTDDTLKMVRHHKEMFNHNFTILSNDFDQDDPKMNGIQRNTYLNYVKETYPNDWCLAIDADEVVEDFNEVKKAIERLPEGVYSVKMRHLIGDLAHEDAMSDEHFVPNRLFKISCADKYPEVEHPILKPKEGCQISGTRCTTIWHLAYIPNMWLFKERYDSQVIKSDMHSPEFLKDWYHAHLFGSYPKKEFDPVELPDIILKNFGVEKDVLYFKDRNLEVKHSVMVKQWYDFFKPTSVCALGCGKGPYLYYWRWLLEADAVRGYELSQWAVDHAFTPEVIQGDITEYIGADWDLITCIDVLEHLTYKDLKKALGLICHWENSNKVLISVPTIGDPNLDKDSTHKIKETKEWWIKQFTDRKMKLIPTPEHFVFKEQLMIFEHG